MRENSAARSSAPKPIPATAAKYCAVSEQARPNTPIASIQPPAVRITPLSPPRTPESISHAMISGTASSNDASSILNSGLMMLCFL